MINENKHFVLGTQSTLETYGSAVSISISQNMAVSGHEKGQVIYWDLEKKEAIFIVGDAHFSPVTQVSFLGHSNTDIVSCDTQGNFFLLSLKRRQMFSNYLEKTQISVKKNGPIISMQVLAPSSSSNRLLNENQKFLRHPTDDFNLVAIANKSKVLVIQLKPQVSVCCTINKPKNVEPEALPYLCWRPVKDCKDTYNSTPPLLIIGWGGYLFVVSSSVSLEKRQINLEFKVISKKKFRENQKSYFTKKSNETNSKHASFGSFSSFTDIVELPNSPPNLSFRLSPTSIKDSFKNKKPKKETEKLEKPFESTEEDLKKGKLIQIAGLEWLTRKYLILHTSKNLIKVVEPFSGELMETIEISSMKMIFHRYFSSKQNAFESSYHNSIFSRGNVVYFLGTNNLYKTKILEWKDRLDTLVDNKRFLDALSLSHDLFHDKIAIKFGLPKSSFERSQVGRTTIQNLLVKYTNSVLDEIYLSDPSQFEKVEFVHPIRVLASATIDYCLKIDDLQLLFGDIYNKFIGKKHFIFLFFNITFILIFYFNIYLFVFNCFYFYLFLFFLFYYYFNSIK